MTRALVVDGVLAWAMALGGCFPDPPREVDDLVDTKSGDADVRDTDVTADSGDGVVSADTSDGDGNTGTPCREDCTALGTGCTEGYCDDGVCRTRPRAGSCDDGLACTTDDHCEAGGCVGVAKVCGDASALCRENVCDPVDGECRERARAEGGACTDGDACTVGDRCGGGADAGVCVHDSVVVCAPLDDCHEAGVCNPLSGVCSNPAKADGALCESAVGPLHDGDPRGTCKAGVCQQLPEVSVGGSHACALFAGGGIKCWGGGGGWLGYGNTRPIGDDPARSIRGLPDVPAPPARKVVAGAGFTCAVFEDGLRCWGDADSCLGYPGCPRTGHTPATIPSLLPPVPLGMSGGRAVTVQSVSATWERGCVVTGHGSVRCFGYLDDGSEEGATIGYPFEPKVNMPGSKTLEELGDLQLAPPGEVGSVVRVIVGEAAASSCASYADGGLRCWGATTWAGFQTANETFYGDNEAPYLAPMTLGKDRLVLSMCAGYRFYCMLVREEAGIQSLQCWGENASGQLGLEDSTARVLPEAVHLRTLLPGEDVREVSCGGASACVVTSFGRVRCWGDNTRGQLGLGHRSPIGATPFSMAWPDVALPQVAIGVAMGSAVACATLRTGEIACWGAGGFLGTDSANDFGDDGSELEPQPIHFAP